MFTCWWIWWRETQPCARIAHVEMMDSFSSVLPLEVRRANVVSGA